jgi:hypothetical protein
MRTLAGGIAGASYSGAGKSSLSGLASFQSMMARQMSREREARVRALLPPRLALASVRYVGSANTGMAIGTRILIPTAPDPPQSPVALGTDLHKRQIRMMIGVPTALARSHADVLINTITEGGTAPPAWMREGLVALSRQYMARAMTDQNFLTNSYFHAIPLGQTTVTTMRSSQTGTWNVLEGAPDKDGKSTLDPNRDIDIWWAGDRDYFTTCAQVAMLDLNTSIGSYLMPRLYAQVGPGGVTEIMQRLGSGASVDEAFEALTGRGVDAWATQQMRGRARR